MQKIVIDNISVISSFVFCVNVRMVIQNTYTIAMPHLAQAYQQHSYAIIMIIHTNVTQSSFHWFNNIGDSF